MGSRISEREANVLAQYTGINNQILKLNSLITSINSNELDQISSNMRSLEKKFYLVYTLFQSSVYGQSTNIVPSTEESNENDYPQFETNCPPI
ncbi:hypothetical protein BB560_001431 [Smittium megazygosporum]|uniref:DASH complex subunit DAD3 n=1 Tax=Smittium megazygosporum TaxID=133381 RepID=A0A2T9ZHK9_9FUNG|nr:hypothetical protein BB560_001431 [Smittium megazygosporum]